ncbi:universal stress protein UspA [Echinicola pacifica]|uniref:Universal stress protein UspA n=1 Tax=Echinicola pacifica TaxID=346377 RepID=A0A918UPF3_9BACT|nr:universal stress protein [Echinicola pacifica]GGZ26230.1 universal stress protein UspA [Echinicola pacifica]
MKTILVPYDFSPESKNALAFAKGLATINQSHLKLLHVIEIPTGQTFNTMGEVGIGSNEMQNVFMMELIEQRKVQMAELKEENIDLPFKFTTKMIFGNPYAGISNEISETKADLIVMGSKGSSGLEELLIGSNTEKVVRHAKCPVITIKGLSDPRYIKNILFASDFSEENQPIFTQLKKLQVSLNAELHLVKINTSSSFETTRQSRTKVQEFIAKNHLEHVTFDIYNSDTEEEGITEYAEDHNIDLIAMATHGRTGFMHLLSGSIAEDVVNHAKRPVWTMKIK